MVKSKLLIFEERLKENMFLSLKNIDYFKKVKSDGTTIFWPNGLDLCPDALYEKGRDIKKNHATFSSCDQKKKKLLS
jgi:hypothetical protein